MHVLFKFRLLGSKSIPSRLWAGVILIRRPILLRPLSFWHHLQEPAESVAQVDMEGSPSNEVHQMPKPPIQQPGAGVTIDTERTPGALYHLTEEDLQELLTATVREALSKAKVTVETTTPLHPRRLFHTNPLEQVTAPGTAASPTLRLLLDQPQTGTRDTSRRGEAPSSRKYVLPGS
ncbi:hypothetical protein Salat_1436900 [Sesamum alatum]|uniref:Uncharacterized protein n=1 Tax=Sesamum alatum TaxID=300844 RepID=A0AAE1YAS9_9LAMI|nr:hypothetical protein Salat_1436900 [Sesamum alatum]